jgi:hypothetical protein
MAITDQERERIQTEKMARWLVRQELRRERRPQLLAIATIWAFALTCLAAAFTR